MTERAFRRPVLTDGFNVPDSASLIRDAVAHLDVSKGADVATARANHALTTVHPVGLGVPPDVNGDWVIVRVAVVRVSRGEAFECGFLPKIACDVHSRNTL